MNMPTITTDAMTQDAVELLQSISKRAADLAGTLPVLDLPPEELARVAGELERVAVKLAKIEEAMAQMGPMSAQC